MIGPHHLHQSLVGGDENPHINGDCLCSWSSSVSSRTTVRHRGTEILPKRQTPCKRWPSARQPAPRFLGASPATGSACNGCHGRRKPERLRRLRTVRVRRNLPTLAPSDR